MPVTARIPAFEARLDLERLDWRATARPGVSWILISPSRDELRARQAAGDPAEVVALIRMAPGHGYPAHRHLGAEEVLVLQGGYADGPGDAEGPGFAEGPGYADGPDEAAAYPAGTWLRYPAGSSHAPRALGDPERPEGPENPCCVLFATAHGGVELLEEALSDKDRHPPRRPSY